MADSAKAPTRTNAQAGWRLPPDLLRLVRIDAFKRGKRQNEVIRERLEESFRMRPVGIEPSRVVT